jgi:cyclohexanone monooxygenase
MERDYSASLLLPDRRELVCVLDPHTTIRSLAGNSREFLSACTPGYYNNEGDTSAGGLLDQVYTPGINQFNAMLAEWREKGDLEGLQLYK